jgi:hypothetical protein
MKGHPTIPARNGLRLGRRKVRLNGTVHCSHKGTTVSNFRLLFMFPQNPCPQYGPQGKELIRLHIPHLGSIALNFSERNREAILAYYHLTKKSPRRPSGQRASARPSRQPEPTNCRRSRRIGGALTAQDGVALRSERPSSTRAITRSDETTKFHCNRARPAAHHKRCASSHPKFARPPARGPFRAPPAAALTAIAGRRDCGCRSGGRSRRAKASRSGSHKCAT